MSTASQSEMEASANRLFATKENSAIKWQRARGVVGALEVKSEPVLSFKHDLHPHMVHGKDTSFHDALQAWDDLKLRSDFIKACEDLPKEMCCCGFMNDEEATKRRFVTSLNEKWCKQANKKLLKNSRGVKVDVFLWNWQNASGKSETNIIMIRFFELSSSRFRRASAEGSIDFELLDMEEITDGAEGSENSNPDIAAPELAPMSR